MGGVGVRVGVRLGTVGKRVGFGVGCRVGSRVDEREEYAVLLVGRSVGAVVVEKMLAHLGRTRAGVCTAHKSGDSILGDSCRRSCAVRSIWPHSLHNLSMYPRLMPAMVLLLV